jgi:host factor-I protein
MNKPNINIQDGFLFQSLKDGRPMSFELTTGRHIEGKIRRFDRFAVVVESGGREVLLYKHAIATISAAGGEG